MRCLIFFTLLLAALPASAGEMRYPASGAPAVTVDIPDGWSAKETDGKLVAASADGSSTVTISIAPYAGSLDALADETLKAAGIDPPSPDERHAVLVADLTGFWWPSQQTDARGKTRHVFFCDVMLGDGKALTGILVSPDDDGPGFHAGLHILDRMKLAH